MNKKFYISITPLLSSEELKFLNDFNDLLILGKKTYTPNNSIWLYKKEEINEGFAVIKYKTNQEDLKLELEANIEKISKYSSSSMFINNFMLLTNYKELFLPAFTTHQHANNYKIEHNDSPLFSHLFKLIHIFHEDGMIKKFLKLNFEHHEFSEIVIDEKTEDGYIIKGTNIYDSSVLQSGYYTKKNNISLNWGSYLFETMQKVELQNKLTNTLFEKATKEHVHKL